MFGLGSLELKIVGVILAALALLGAYEAWAYHERSLGESKAREQYDLQIIKNQKTRIENMEKANAESNRRLLAQEENQRVQDKELKIARDAATRNAHDAQQLREQNSVVARRWVDRLTDHTATQQDLAAAGATIVLLTDMLGRRDERSGQRSAFADASRAAGLKCERDYDALTPAH